MNKFELKGEVVAIEVLKEGKAARMDLKVVYNDHTEVIPVIAFNKLSDVLVHYTTVGNQVEVFGALRLNNRTNFVDLVAFKITKLEQKNTTTDKKVTKINKTSTGISKKDTAVKKTVINGPIKKIDRFDGFVVNVYDNLSQAAEDMKVKKSDMKKAIENGTVLAGYKWIR